MQFVEKKKHQFSHLTPLIAGGVAPLFVVFIVYPLDTLKTRLQAPQGFYKAGGFRGIYSGLLSLMTGSIPINALFFGTYEASKEYFEPLVAPQRMPVLHMCIASCCRALTSLIRVPVEVVKQRKQTDTHNRSTLLILIDAYRKDGIRYGLYRGFMSTVVRDLPFSFIELPTWELLKTWIKNRNNGEITSFQSAKCGFIASGLAAAITTPIDLAKTRIVLADADTNKPVKEMSKLRIRTVLSEIYYKAGVRGLFAGVTLRMTMIMTGKFIFFGAYEETKRCLDEYFEAN